MVAAAVAQVGAQLWLLFAQGHESVELPHLLQELL